MLNDFHSHRQVSNGEVQLKWLHRFALLTAATTFFLIFVGGLVKSHEAGLSVPDWPNTYGEFMLTFPYSKWVGNIFYEHSHRLLATLTGFFITIQAIWLQFSPVNKKLKQLGWFALLGVVTQGIFGGLTVIYLLPTSISTVHSMLAQAVFCLTLAMALFTSTGWKPDTKADDPAGLSLRRLSFWTTLAIFLQIMLGAVMRHENAGLAIPTFPLSNGRFIPEFSSVGIALNFAHRLGAVCVTILVLTTVWTILKSVSTPRIRKLSYFAIVILVIQVTLGAITILSEKAVTPTTLHVSGGSALLGTMLLISIRVFHSYSARTAVSEQKTKSERAESFAGSSVPSLQ